MRPKIYQYYIASNCFIILPHICEIKLHVQNSHFDTLLNVKCQSLKDEILRQGSFDTHRGCCNFSNHQLALSTKIFYSIVYCLVFIFKQTLSAFNSVL